MHQSKHYTSGTVIIIYYGYSIQKLSSVFKYIFMIILTLKIYFKVLESLSKTYFYIIHEQHVCGLVIYNFKKNVIKIINRVVVQSYITL